jgi:hypothetical protein
MKIISFSQLSQLSDSTWILDSALSQPRLSLLRSMAYSPLCLFLSTPYQIKPRQLSFLIILDPSTCAWL